MTSPLTATVTVTGHATVAASPDSARIRLGLQAARTTVAQAVADSSAGVTRVRAALTSRGIATADAPSGRVSITTQEKWENNVASIIGYQAEHQITVTVRSVDEVGGVLTEIVDAAGDTLRLYGVDFELADDAPLRRQAKDDAFAQALATAQQYAALASRSLGAVLQVAEGAASTPFPAPKGRMMAVAMADSMPVEPGAVDTQATVTVTWELV